MSLIDESSTDTAAATLDDGVADAKMSSTDRKLAAIALATGLLVRLAAALLLPDQGMPDAAVLRSSALNLWSTGQLGASHIMPLYPLLVGLVGPGAGQLALDVALSTAAVGLIYLLTLTMFSDRLAAFLAAMGTALTDAQVDLYRVGFGRAQKIFIGTAIEQYCERHLLVAAFRFKLNRRI